MKMYIKYIPYGKSYSLVKFSDGTHCISIGYWKFYLQLRGDK